MNFIKNIVCPDCWYMNMFSCWAGGDAPFPRCEYCARSFKDIFQSSHEAFLIKSLMHTEKPGFYYYVNRDTSHEICYKGFQRFSRQDIAKAWRVVLANLDGEHEIWLIDSEEGLQNLKRYYEADWGQDKITYILLDPHCEQNPKAGFAFS